LEDAARPRQLHPVIDNFLDFAGNRAECLRINAVPLISGQRFTGKLQKYPGVGFSAHVVPPEFFDFDLSEQDVNV
jgi:hypothetical protein